MNTQRPPFFQAPPPAVETPAPLHLPAPSSGELLGRLGTVAALTMGGTMGLILLGLTASWGVGGLTLLLVVGDGLLWAGAWLASFPLRAAVADYHLRRSALELELDERAAYLELGRALLRAWGRKSYGRQAKPLERVVWVRDGASNTSSAVRGETDSSVAYSGFQGHENNRARVAQTADDETRPLGELAGPAVWTPAMAVMQELRKEGLAPTWENCRTHMSRAEWQFAKAELERMQYLAQGGRGRAAEWR
jgi:hypothetical protein